MDRLRPLGIKFLEPFGRFLALPALGRLPDLFCQFTNFRGGHSFPPKLKMSTLADILDKPGPETSDALTSGVPDTPIKDSIGAVFQKRGSQFLRILVGVRPVVGCKLGIGWPNVMKLGAKPRDVFPELYSGFENADLS